MGSGSQRSFEHFVEGLDHQGIAIVQDDFDDRGVPADTLGSVDPEGDAAAMSVAVVGLHGLEGQLEGAVAPPDEAIVIAEQLGRLEPSFD
jgi:hypothetical protein